MIRITSYVSRPCWLAVYMLDHCCFGLGFFFKPWRNLTLTCLMFFVLTRYKPVLKTLLLKSSFSVSPGKETFRLVLSLVQIKFFSILIIDCSLTIFIDKRFGANGLLEWVMVTPIKSMEALSFLGTEVKSRLDSGPHRMKLWSLWWPMCRNLHILQKTTLIHYPDDIMMIEPGEQE